MNGGFLPGKTGKTHLGIDRWKARTVRSKYDTEELLVVADLAISLWSTWYDPENATQGSD